MEISISITLDEGFLRRECPNCERQFKWYDGPTDNRPDDAVDPAMYSCPYCGLTSDADQWWTPAQSQYIEEVMLGQAGGILGDALEDAFRGSKDVQFKPSKRLAPVPPGPPPEPHDMVGVEPPCHPWEPIKVLDDWTDPLRCIVCGEKFAV